MAKKIEIKNKIYKISKLKNKIIFFLISKLNFKVKLL